MAKRSMFVGMDVHKEAIDISVAEDGRTGEVRHYGVIAGDLRALDKVVHALRAPGRRLEFVYEAGPCGFGIYRHLTGQGEMCTVVSPSHIPKRSGDRIKTDRRDGNALARLHRAGELRAIYVPTAEDEAIRDLVRAREDAVGVSTQAKHRLKAFLLRQGRRYSGGATWTLAYTSLAGEPEFPVGAAAYQRIKARVSRHDRRSRTTAGTVDGSTTSAGAGLAVGAGGPRPASASWRLVCHSGWLSRRSRRLAPLPTSARIDGVPRARALRILQWRECASWHDHENRQSPRTSAARRSRLGVSRPSAHRAPGAGATRRGAADRARHRLEGATPIDDPLSPLGGTWESQTEGRDGRRFGN